MKTPAADLLPIRAIGVIGAGTAGREFTRECVRAGYTVYLEDVMPARLRQAESELQAETERTDQLVLVDTVEDAVRSVDLVIDFVPDELESKLEILSMADRMAPPRTILCTPTDRLSIADLASCVYRPERCVAVRELAQATVRLITPPAVASAVVTTVDEMLRRLGRTVVRETDLLAPMLTKNVVAR